MDICINNMSLLDICMYVCISINAFLCFMITKEV